MFLITNHTNQRAHSLLIKRNVFLPVDIVLPQAAEFKVTIPVVEAWTSVDMILLPVEIGCQGK